MVTPASCLTGPILDTFQKTRLGGVDGDILHAFTAAGLIRAIEPAGSAAVYETRVEDDHPHVVCRLYGAIAGVDCAVDEAEVTYWGFVPDLPSHRRRHTHPTPTAERQDA